MTPRQDVAASFSMILYLKAGVILHGSVQRATVPFVVPFSREFTHGTHGDGHCPSRRQLYPPSNRHVLLRIFLLTYVIIRVATIAQRKRWQGEMQRIEKGAFRGRLLLFPRRKRSRNMVPSQTRNLLFRGTIPRKFLPEQSAISRSLRGSNRFPIALYHIPRGDHDHEIRIPRCIYQRR